MNFPFLNFHRSSAFLFMFISIIILQSVFLLCLIFLFLFVAALTSCVHTDGEVYTGGKIIPFSNVKTRFGISDSIVTALSSSGKFKCEKPGLYLISAFIMSGSTGYTRFNFYRNNDIVSAVFPSVDSGNYQTSTFLILQYLDINDSLYIKPEQNVKIWGNNLYSCISFLQLTNS